jgi:hypothetical protein
MAATTSALRRLTHRVVVADGMVSSVKASPSGPMTDATRIFPFSNIAKLRQPVEKNGYRNAVNRCLAGHTSCSFRVLQRLLPDDRMINTASMAIIRNDE